ncbi:unnamed protein product [Rotaria sp. Silwood2]|nr:unnamed protein product [Rotaria sp. Silwood2]
MEVVAKALLTAKEEVFITDWWLSSEIMLIRSTDDETFRLDNLLGKIADGVGVYVMVLKEVSFGIGLNSLHTKRALIDKILRCSFDHIRSYQTFPFIFDKFHLFRNITNSSIFITVGVEGSTTNNNFQFVLNDQHALLMSELSEAFPGVIGLKYRDAESDPWNLVANKDADDNLKPDDWDTWYFNMVYVPLYPICTILLFKHALKLKRSSFVFRAQPAVVSIAPSALVDESRQAASCDRLFVFEKGW